MSKNIKECMQKYREVCNKLERDEHPVIIAALQIEEDENEIEQKDSASLYLAGNNAVINSSRLTDFDAEVVSDWLTDDCFVTSLDLRYNSLSDEGAKHIALLLKAQNELTELNLMFNDFADEGARLIAEALHTNTKLKTLRLTGNKIGNVGGMYFAEALRVNNTLEALDLADTDLKAESLVAIATVLNSNQSLKALNVSRPLLTSLQEETTDHFARMIKVNRGLEELHMMKHGMMDLGAIRIGEDLMYNCSISYLNLSCNKISSDGVRVLARLLEANTGLRVLDISFNRIGDMGSRFLAEAIGTKNTQLKSLDIRSNALSGEGLTAIAEALTTNSALEDLYVWGNNTEQESGAAAFKNLYDRGRLQAANTDVLPYIVDGHVHLSQLSNGLRSWYYWGPWQGDAALPHLKKFVNYKPKPVGKLYSYMENPVYQY